MEEPYNQTPAYSYTAGNILLLVTLADNYTFFPEPLDSTTVTYFQHLAVAQLIIDALIFTIALPVICVSIYGLYSLVKTNNVSAVYVINLFIADLIQISARLLLDTLLKTNHILFNIYRFSVGVNICFMMCVSLERYAMIAHPVWYRNIQMIRTTIFVSVTVWILAVILSIIIFYFSKFTFVFVPLFLLLPYPLVMFFCVRTWRALSRTTSVPRNDQRRIMGILALVLCVYTILFLPTIVIWPVSSSYINFWFYYIAHILIGLNPLFDPVLYVLMRRDTKDILTSLPFCFSRRHEEDIQLQQL